MTAANWFILAGQLLILIGVIFTAVYGNRWRRAQPIVDETTAVHTGVDSDRLRQTIEQMNETANARRDTRLAQLHAYLLADYEWHLVVVTNELTMVTLIKRLIKMVEELGGDTSGITIPPPSPPPPPIPDPPPIPNS